MKAIVFDTLRLAQKLEAAGFTAQQAQGAATAISEVLGEHVATQRDVQDIRRDIGDARKDVAAVHKDIAAVHREIADVRKDMLEIEARMRSESAAEAKTLRAEAAAESKALRAEIRDMGQQLTIRLGGMMAAAIAIVAALVKLL